MTNLQQLHDKVWRWRRYMDANSEWTTPDTLDCLRFSVTEAAEALDSWLRQKGGYARNRDKAHSVYAELAQCALMLMTALGPDYDGFDSGTPIFNWDGIDWVVRHVTHVLGDYVDGDNWYWSALFAIDLIAAYPGMDLDQELDAAMTRLEAKHCHPHPSTGALAGHDGYPAWGPPCDEAVD